MNKPVAETLSMSVTFTVKLALTADEGAVPVKAPAGVKVNHDGRPVADQV
jgi:hypothetical protein